MSDDVKHPNREYSARALMGVAVPQANPIVEPEFSVLMPAGVGVIATRLQGSRTDSGNRIIEYLDNLGTSIEAYDSTNPDALGYACTGTSYMIGQQEEKKRIDIFQDRFGFPIITSAQAILRACDFLGINKVALLAPYPQWIIDKSLIYWQQCGLVITHSTRTTMDTTDTRAVYQMRAPMVMQAADNLDSSDADAILISGTGMPSLRVMSALSLKTGKPVLSSNLCLAWAMLQEVGIQPQLARSDKGEVLIGQWVEKAAML